MALVEILPKMRALLELTKRRRGTRVPWVGRRSAHRARLGSGGCCRTDLVCGMSAWPRPRVTQDVLQASWTNFTKHCVQSKMASDGPRGCHDCCRGDCVRRATHGSEWTKTHGNNAFFLLPSPKKHAMFLQRTSMDHARVQALGNSHICSDFGFVTMTPIIPRMSTRSHLLLQAAVHLVHLGYSLWVDTHVQLVGRHKTATLPHQPAHVFPSAVLHEMPSAPRPNSAKRVPESVPHADIAS